MINNKCAFVSSEYDRKIRQTLPYYDEFYQQVIGLVKTFPYSSATWLDIGCGTGKMGSVAFENMELEKFVFCDASDEMINIVKERFRCPNAEFCVCDVQNLTFEKEFDVVTAIQVHHYLQREERKTALKENGLFICFENVSPFTDTGKTVYLEKWKRYQIKQGKSLEESEQHIKRYEKDYFPITLEEHLRLMKDCGFKVIEILWFSNMQAGFWGMK